MKKNRIIPISIILLGFVIIVPFQISAEDTTINIYVNSEGDLNASINGSAGGDVNYYIDGIEIKGEFISIWDAIGDVNTVWDVINHFNMQLEKTDGISVEAFNIANDAYSYAENAYSYAHDNSQKLGEHDQTLLIHYDAINETYSKLYILRDEVMLFEGHYFNFVNSTNSTLNNHETTIKTQIAELARLKSDLNGIVMLIRNILIGIGIVACGLYITNKKYPFGEILKNGNNIFHQNGNNKKAKTRVKTKKLAKKTIKTN